MFDKILKAEITPLSIFFIFSFLGIISFFIFAFIYGGSCFDWLLMENNGKLHFVDYFTHLSYVADPELLYPRATSTGGCFPAFSYMMYYFLYNLTDKVGMFHHSYFIFRSTEHVMLVFVYYTISVLFFLYIVIFNTLKRNQMLSICVFLSLIFSAVFLGGGVERGNSAILVLTFMLLGLNFKQSKNKVLNEIALIIFAICTGFKIYPAIISLLYLREKRFREFIRFFIYACILFFVPFAFFGGMAGFKIWVNNILNFMNMNSFYRYQYVKGFLYNVSYHFIPEYAKIFSAIGNFIFLFVMIILAMVTKNKYSRLFFLCSIMTFFPVNAYRYTLCYLSIPLIFYIRDYNNSIKTSLDYILMSLYGCLFSIPVFWGIVTSFKLNFGSNATTSVEIWLYCVAYLMLILVSFKEISEIIKYKVQKNS